MVLGAAKRQIVIAGYDDARSVAWTIAGLLTAGIAAAQIELVGAQAACAELARCLEALEGAQLVRLLPDAAVHGAATITLEPAHHAGGNGNAAQSVGVGRQDFVSQLRPEAIGDHMRAGTIMLAVMPANVEQRRDATRLMLERSSRHVETHEFRPEWRWRHGNTSAAVTP